MADEQAKRLIYKNLSDLKQFPKDQGVGLTDDYTPAERQLLKGWIVKPKHKTETETDDSIIWRVRGSPKNVLFLVSEAPE